MYGPGSSATKGLVRLFVWLSCRRAKKVEILQYSLCQAGPLIRMSRAFSRYELTLLSQLTKYFMYRTSRAFEKSWETTTTTRDDRTSRAFSRAGTTGRPGPLVTRLFLVALVVYLSLSLSLSPYLGRAGTSRHYYIQCMDCMYCMDCMDFNFFFFKRKKENEEKACLL